MATPLPTGSAGASGAPIALIIMVTSIDPAVPFLTLTRTFRPIQGGTSYDLQFVGVAKQAEFGLSDLTLVYEGDTYWSYVRIDGNATEGFEIVYQNALDPTKLQTLKWETLLGKSREKAEKPPHDWKQLPEAWKLLNGELKPCG